MLNLGFGVARFLGFSVVLFLGFGVKPFLGFRAKSRQYGPRSAEWGVRAEPVNQGALSASTTVERMDLIAGNSPPRMPMLPAKAIASSTNGGDTLSV